MSDQERGAYTPQSEAPLAFDARSPRERRPVPMTLVASAAVLLVLVAAVVMAYRHGGRGDAPARTVGEPAGAIKTAAAPDAQPRDPASGLDVYAAQNVPTTQAQPKLAPPPEQPLPRAPAPQLQVKAVEPAPVRIAPPEPDHAAPATAVVTTPPRAPTPAPKTQVATVTPPEPAPTGDAPATAIRPGAAAADAARYAAQSRATTVQTAKTTATTKTATAAAKPVATAAVSSKPETSAGAGAAAVQIGAYSSRALADKGYADVSAMMSGRMGGRGKAVTAVEKGSATLYRAQITGFPDHAAAKAFCDALAAKGHSCIVKG